MHRAVLLLAFFAIACGDDSDQPDVGAIGDASTQDDAGEMTDAGTDGMSTDSGEDASADALSMDVGLDGGLDAALDVPPDVPDTCPPLDLLFVVDDSGSMEEEQDALAAAVPRILAALDAARSGMAELDYHVGVTTTGKDLSVSIEFTGSPSFPPMMLEETGPGGALLQPELCDMAQPWLERSDLGAEESLQCLMRVGTAGSSYEMPLLATELALTTHVVDGSNEGFLRPDAHLGVIIITDENDCSLDADAISAQIPVSPDGAESDPCDDANDIARTVALLDDVHGDRSRWSMTIFAAPEDCESALGSATAAPRLFSFADLAPTSVETSSICTGMLEASIEAAVQRVARCE